VKEAPDGFYTFNAEERQAAAKGREVAWQMCAIKKQQLICSFHVGFYSFLLA
jgi:hypothetical protein